jgi:hypothetical protein
MPGQADGVLHAAAGERKIQSPSWPLLLPAAASSTARIVLVLRLPKAMYDYFCESMQLCQIFNSILLVYIIYFCGINLQSCFFMTHLALPQMYVFLARYLYYLYVSPLRTINTVVPFRSLT